MIASFIGAGVLLILAGLCLVHARLVPPGAELLAQSVQTTAVTA